MKKSEILLACLLLANCATAPNTHEKTAKEIRQEILDTKTVLDVATPTPIKAEARLEVNLENGHLTDAQQSQIKALAQDFKSRGRGNLVISVPQNTTYDGDFAVLSREIANKLYASGIELNQMHIGNIQGGQEPKIIITYSRYEVEKVQCKSWANINARAYDNNDTVERFGCSQAANLASMVVDPADLQGENKEAAGEAAASQTGIDAYRKGQLKAPNVSTGQSSSSSGGPP